MRLMDCSGLMEPEPAERWAEQLAIAGLALVEPWVAPDGRLTALDGALAPHALDDGKLDG